MSHLRPLCCVLVLAPLLAAGCRITPEEIERIETENELLREQIAAMRGECLRYRDLDLEVDERNEEAPAP
jgi:hypothetical protein